LRACGLACGVEVCDVGRELRIKGVVVVGIPDYAPGVVNDLESIGKCSVIGCDAGIERERAIITEIDRALVCLGCDKMYDQTDTVTVGVDLSIRVKIINDSYIDAFATPALGPGLSRVGVSRRSRVLPGVDAVIGSAQRREAGRAIHAGVGQRKEAGVIQSGSRVGLVRRRTQAVVIGCDIWRDWVDGVSLQAGAGGDIGTTRASTAAAANEPGGHHKDKARRKTHLSPHSSPESII